MGGAAPAVVARAAAPSVMINAAPVATIPTSSTVTDDTSTAPAHAVGSMAEVWAWAVAPRARAGVSRLGIATTTTTSSCTSAVTAVIATTRAPTMGGPLHAMRRPGTADGPGPRGAVGARGGAAGRGVVGGGREGRGWPG